MVEKKKPRRTRVQMIAAAQKALCRVQGHDWGYRVSERNHFCRTCGIEASGGGGSYDSEAAEQYHGT